MIDAIKKIKISDFDYPLSDERIAAHPLAERDACRLLVSRGMEDISHLRFYDLPSLLPDDALLVCNDTRVINARITFEKTTGSRIEVFLLEPVSPEDYVLTFQTRGRCVWKCMVGNLKRWKEGLVLRKKLILNDREVTLSAKRMIPLDGNAHEVEFSWDDEDFTFASIVDAAGYIPIPPYLRRPSEESDTYDYQTVYSRIKGSVAAPTAGLHFTDSVIKELRDKGIDMEALTLHVGAGTFQPVKSETIGGHPMHTETFGISRALIEKIIEYREKGRPVIAVGTTTVRTLESLPYLGSALLHNDFDLHVGQWWPYGEAPFKVEDTDTALTAILIYMDKTKSETLTASTAIMIAPGFEWKIVNGMVTNFHQPQSTLLLLVSSFLEREENTRRNWREIYKEALANDYRFLSYGDACLFL